MAGGRELRDRTAPSNRDTFKRGSLDPLHRDDSRFEGSSWESGASTSKGPTSTQPFRIVAGYTSTLDTRYRLASVTKTFTIYDP